MNQAGHNPTFCSLLQGSRMLQSKVIEQSSKFAVRKSHQDSHLVPGEPRKFWALSSLAAFFLDSFPVKLATLGNQKSRVCPSHSQNIVNLKAIVMEKWAFIIAEPGEKSSLHSSLWTCLWLLQPLATLRVRG